MIIFYEIISLILGLLSWTLAFISIRRHRYGFLNLTSLSACIISLLLQLMATDYMANVLEDMSVVMDTIGASTTSGWIMFIISLVLNYISYSNEKKNK